eukprot:GEMP01031085.1.p1 GENE.GEMP01031085.1~~GEMP01031085.1.p1  ORF type:complete len:278 (+),score=46.05 GEMP01031085.1:243-1076(+)
MTIAECDADLDTDDSDTPRQGDVYWALSVLFLLVLIAFLAMFVIDTNQTMRFLLKLAGNRPSSGTLIGWMLLTIAVVVSCVPVWSLMLMAQGFIFELRVALATNFVALVAAAVISYGIGKNFGDPVRRLFKRHFPNGHQFAKAMVAKGLWHLLVFRFAWVAMGARNYLPVLFKARFWPFLFSVVVHSAWVAFMFSIIGSGLRDAADSLSKHNFEGSYWDNFPLEKLWMACASIAGTILITVLACVEYFSIANRNANERTPLITECNERRPLIAEVGM